MSNELNLEYEAMLATPVGKALVDKVLEFVYKDVTEPLTWIEIGGVLATQMFQSEFPGCVGRLYQYIVETRRPDNGNDQNKRT